MRKKILIIQGHPDASHDHFCHALAESYKKGALEAGYEVKSICVANIEFPLLRTYEDFYSSTPIPVIEQCQQDIRWANHLVIVYPLWMGTMPALLKAFFEQVFRPGFALETVDGGKKWIRLLKGKSAHIVVTMGMPAFIYRWFYRAHGLKSLERNILNFTGISTIRNSLIGMVEESQENRVRWLEKMYVIGKKGG
ncbi:MAG: NAD(P)H-dependent oxidoreductase [Thiotrichales bacterium]|nr:MAG: NAD(P)H-dependent oxidoreductase [Thiotrichales bacterium]